MNHSAITNLKLQKQDIAIEIQNIFDQTKLEDLKRFMRKRECLNQTNMIMIYLFHIIQSAGILTTTIAAGYEMKELVWIGAGLNLLASLINIFEQTNNSISKKLLKDITSIKNDTYVDEGISVMPDKETESHPTPPSQSPPQSIEKSIKSPYSQESDMIELSNSIQSIQKTSSLLRPFIQGSESTNPPIPRQSV